MPGPARILITGAGGFVGQHLLKALSSRFPAASLYTERFDVTDPSAVSAAFTGFRPDACIHLAAIASVQEARRDPARTFAVNLTGTLNIAGAMLETTPECRLIYVGSSDSYGASFRAGVALDETAPLEPLNIYAASKAAADLTMAAMAAESGLRVIRFRPFNHTGPGQSEAYVIPAFAAQIARIEAGAQEPVIRVGNIEAARDFMHVADVVRAYALALEQFDALPNGAVFNLASGQPRKIGDILAAMIARAAVPIRVEVDPARLRPVEIMRAVGDAGKAYRLLNWKPLRQATTESFGGCDGSYSE